MPRVQDGYLTSMPVVSRIAGSVAPSALQDFASDIDALFVPPRQLPAPGDRARALVDSIDWTQPVVVIWIPGTSGHEVPEHVAQRLAAAGGPAAHTLQYQATWRLRESVPDGEATLRAVLELVGTRRRRRGQRVVLLGESQGAWIISSILREPRFAKLVHRASLVAHPALAPAHAHESTSTQERLGPAVREFNGAADVVTREVGKSHDVVLDVVDSFARLEVGRALKGAVGILLTNPGLLQVLVASQVFRVKGAVNPHGSDDLMSDAIAWILGR
ncbi:MAG: hypothetical protein JWL76_255 [Thermoleophilia bacterium]|nr:hypothetical protein [Thermoleophilia bacterium]